jgi:galactokinase
VNAGMREMEAEKKAGIFESVERYLSATEGVEPLRWFVPGRIEVLGKHTDYAGGRSLLCAAERGFCLSAVARQDNVLRITDAIRQASFECEISDDLPVPYRDWRVYPAVVARRLARNFPGGLSGAEICLASDLPSAAGMSSSSALVTAVFAALSRVNELTRRDEYVASLSSLADLAAYLGCIENGQTYQSLIGDGGVGTFGGSEDHTAILSSDPGHLKQYSFCPVRHECTVKLPDDCIFVIGVSGIVADKTGSAKVLYNQASLRVREILERWRTFSQSNHASLAAAANSSQDAPDRIRAVLRQSDSSAKDAYALLYRFEQFWLESQCIIPEASDALARGDLTTFGAAVEESQRAAETLLGNQVPETIWLAQQAARLGAYAASAFGAGFGGSVWALVLRKDALEFTRQWRHEYEHSSFAAARASEFFVTAPGPALLQL